MKQTDEQLREHLRGQVGFMLASIEAFHARMQAEAKRMATAVRG